MHDRRRRLAPLTALVLPACLLGAVTLAAPAPATTAAAPGAWKAVAASGRVEARPGAHEAWDRVRRGDRVQAASAVRTGDRGRTTLVRNRDIVTVSPDSELQLPLEGPVRQDSGRVVYEIDGEFQRDFRVETPYLVAGVKGTVFMVTVERGFAAVTVDEGVVEVLDRATGQLRDIHEGETALVDRDTEAMEVVRHDARRDRGPRDGQRGPRADLVQRARAEARALDLALDIRDHQVQAKFADWIASAKVDAHGKDEARPDRPDPRPGLKDELKDELQGDLQDDLKDQLKEMLDRPDDDGGLDDELDGDEGDDRPLLDLLDELLLDMEIDLLRDRILDRKRRDALRDLRDDALDPALDRGDRDGRRIRDGVADDAVDDPLLDRDPRGDLGDVRDEAGSERGG